MLNRVFWNVETIYTSSTFTHIFYWPKTKIGDLWPEQEKKQTKKVLQYPQQTTLGTAGSLLSCYPSITRMNRNTETLPIIYGSVGICWAAAGLKIYILIIFHKMYRRPVTERPRPTCKSLPHLSNSPTSMLKTRPYTPKFAKRFACTTIHTNSPSTTRNSIKQSQPFQSPL